MPLNAKDNEEWEAEAQEVFPPGELLIDTANKSWRLGSVIGQVKGSLLYLANEESAKNVDASTRYLIRVEPEGNVCLFSELRFDKRAARPDLIQSWKKYHKMKHLWVPTYWGSGLHYKGDKRYRFMVRDGFGTKLSTIFNEGKKFPRKVVRQLGRQLLDILEYPHENEYSHANIKAANLHISHGHRNQVNLVNYELAFRYSPAGVHVPYQVNPKHCHRGTLAFTSIDAHNGAAPSRSSDLESLAYSMIKWQCGLLPWEDNRLDTDFTMEFKVLSRDDSRGFMADCFPSGEKPVEMAQFLQEVKVMGYMDKPKYASLLCILQEGLKSIDAADDGILDFAMPPEAPCTPTPTTPNKGEEKSHVAYCSTPIKSILKRANSQPSDSDLSKTVRWSADLDPPTLPPITSRQFVMPARLRRRAGNFRGNLEP